MAGIGNTEMGDQESMREIWGGEDYKAEQKRSGRIPGPDEMNWGVGFGSLVGI